MTRTPKPPPSGHHARPGLRVARMCKHKDCVPPWRQFGDPAAVCPQHGKQHTITQENRPYFGQPT